MIYAENILICISVPLLISLIFVRGNTGKFVASFIIGMAVCLISAYISGFIDLASHMGDEDTAIFISPIVEEIMKLLPLLFYLLMFDPKDDSLHLCALGIGTGFATFENCCYILAQGADSLGYIMIRGMAVGVMHIVSIMALSMAICISRRYKVLSAPAVLGALSLSMTYHGLYNLLVSVQGITSYVGYVLPILTALIMYFPFKRSREME